MAVVKGLNPYDLSNLLKGPCRVLWAPLSVAIPTKLSKIIGVDEGKYEPATGWKDFGATTQGAAYSRQFSVTGFQIEQATGDVDQEITDVVRQVQATFGEITPEFLQMVEQAASIGSVSSSKGNAAEKQVKFGTIESLTAYRIAFVGRRPVGQGADVTEQGGIVRGAMAAACLYHAKLTGDAASIGVAKGQLSSAPLAFQAFSEGGQESGQEQGLWLMEQSGTIPSS